MKLGKFNLQKAVTRDLGNLNQVHDLTGVISRSPNVPSLMTDLMGGSMTTEFLSTDTFEHDDTERFVVDIGDKKYTERGEAFNERESNKTHLFKVPSFGITTQIKPSDAKKARVAGTKDELETIDRLVTQDIEDIRNSMALLRERAIVSTIVNGTLYVPNGSVQSYDFYDEYTDVTAATRPSVAFPLNDAAAYPRETGEDARNLIGDSLLDGQTVNGFIALCGKNFFRKRLSHPKEEQAMVDRSGIMGQDPLIQRLDNFTNGKMYRKYMGSDDILYVEYTARVGGTPLVPDDECYIMPVDAAGIFVEAFAPAETVQYVNTIAEREYAWRYDDEFSGTKLFFESNFGIYLVNPLSIIKGTIAA